MTRLSPARFLAAICVAVVGSAFGATARDRPAPRPEFAQSNERIAECDRQRTACLQQGRLEQPGQSNIPQEVATRCEIAFRVCINQR